MDALSGTATGESIGGPTGGSIKGGTNGGSIDGGTTGGVVGGRTIGGVSEGVDGGISGFIMQTERSSHPPTKMATKPRLATKKLVFIFFLISLLSKVLPLVLLRRLCTLFLKVKSFFD